MHKPLTEPPEGSGVLVIAPDNEQWTRELLGDARDVADRLGVRVDVLTADSGTEQAGQLIAHGADSVWQVVAVERVPIQPAPVEEAPGAAGTETRLEAGAQFVCQHRPRIIFAGASGDERQLAARLAVRSGALLLSPALLVRVREGRCEVTALHPDGCRARQVAVEAGQTAIVALRPGVGQPRRADGQRQGTIHSVSLAALPERATLKRTLPADAATADIQHLPRLLAGGRGLGDRAGFDLLRRVAASLDAGVAASRMAVDLGWIERERQVGQTGKTVSPELYIACGISGASHHLEGMSSSRHIVALNLDPHAPIFRTAHLGLVCDWQPTLAALEQMLTGGK